MTSYLAVLALGALAVAVAPAQVVAQERAGQAMLVGNERYADLPDAAGAGRAMAPRDALEAAGFTMHGGRDLYGPALRAELSALLTAREPSDRVVILLAGHFAHSRHATWFLASDARRPNLATVGGAGVALSTVFEIAAAAPGGAVVLLGLPEDAAAPGAGLSAGIGALEIPQGVTVLRGPASRVSDFAESALVERGRPLAALVADWPALSAEGFLSDLVAFLPEGNEPESGSRAADEALWQRTRRQDTAGAYEAYLGAFPSGRHAGEARDALERLRPSPEQVEERLDLSRDERRAIQRDLNVLGHNTRGIDGIFGPGTRNAISEWQGNAALATTGFLTREQITRLSGQAARRAAQLEQEARERRAEQERQDRAYWEETGARGDEAGLSAYLERYPDGLYADDARAQLDAIRDRRERRAAERDRDAWDAARREDTVRAYQGYLREYPDGAFAARARERIDELTGQSVPDRDRAAEAAEAALNLDPMTRTLIERRLERLGLQPGPVDGRFDDSTRRAIRRYQRAADLPVTGYITREMVSRMLAESVFQLFE